MTWNAFSENDGFWIIHANCNTKVHRIQTMEELEKIDHEIVKNVLKMSVMNNASLSQYQKQQAINIIDRAAQQADWIIEMLKMYGYIKKD